MPSTLLPLAIGSMAAYAFAWIRFPLRDTIFLSIVALMVVPVQTAFVPILVEFQDLGEFLTGTKTAITGWYFGIWIAHTVFALPFCVFLLRNFFITLPRDLIEAARVDGASNWKIFRSIVLPLSVPALASFAIFQFLWVWNDLLMALVFIQESDQWPMTIRISQTALDVRCRVPPAERGRVPADGRAADRLLRAAALLRAGSARRLRQIAPRRSSTWSPTRTGTASGTCRSRASG